MAGKTATRDTAVVKSGHMPTYGGMAVVALVITIDVIPRLTGGTAIVMTAVAQYGSAGKFSIDVTLIALHIAMLTAEREPGGEMVVIREYR